MKFSQIVDFILLGFSRKRRAETESDVEISHSPPSKYCKLSIENDRDLDIVYERPRAKRLRNMSAGWRETSSTNEDDDEVRYLGENPSFRGGPSVFQRFRPGSVLSSTTLSTGTVPTLRQPSSRIGIRSTRSKRMLEKIQHALEPDQKSKENAMRNKVFSPFQKKPLTQSLMGQQKFRQAKDLMQYKKLVDFHKNSTRPLARCLNSFTIPEIRGTSSFRRQIPTIDFEKEATAIYVNRSKENIPSTSATRAEIKLDDSDDEVQVVEPTKIGIRRVNSLNEYMRVYDIKPEQLIKETCEKHRINIEAKRREAEIEEKKLSVFTEHNRKVLVDAVEERMRNYVRISEPPVIQLEEEEYILPELSSEQNKKVEEALKPKPPEQILVDKFGYQIRRSDIATLKGTSWLNDEVINFYMSLLIERGKLPSLPTTYAFNTFFYPKLSSSGHTALKRWTRKVDIFAHDLVFVPIHLGMHWCMSVIDFKAKEIQYYDSLGMANQKVLKALMDYLKAESLDKKKAPFSDNGWTLRNMDDIPKQQNSHDCGVFACTFAEHIARKAAIGFSQEHMPFLRRKMICEIIEGRLLT